MCQSWTWTWLRTQNSCLLQSQYSWFSKTLVHPCVCLQAFFFFYWFPLFKTSSLIHIYKKNKSPNEQLCQFSNRRHISCFHYFGRCRVLCIVQFFFVASHLKLLDTGMYYKRLSWFAFQSVSKWTGRFWKLVIWLYKWVNFPMPPGTVCVLTNVKYGNKLPIHSPRFTAGVKLKLIMCYHGSLESPWDICLWDNSLSIHFRTLFTRSVQFCSEIVNSRHLLFS